MNIELDLKKLYKNNLSPNQYVILTMIYYKEWGKIIKLFSVEKALQIRNSLVNTKYILDKDTKKIFNDTVISTSHVEKLLGIRSDNINFLEFFNEYPMKVGNRVLRPKNSDTIEGKKLKKKYLAKVKSLEDHKLAVEATKAFVRRQRISSNLEFLPGLEVVINNAKWQSWETFITRFAEGKTADHIDSI